MTLVWASWCAYCECLWIAERDRAAKLGLSECPATIAVLDCPKIMAENILQLWYDWKILEDPVAVILLQIYGEVLFRTFPHPLKATGPIVQIGMDHLLQNGQLTLAEGCKCCSQACDTQVWVHNSLLAAINLFCRLGYDHDSTCFQTVLQMVGELVGLSESVSPP